MSPPASEGLKRPSHSASGTAIPIFVEETTVVDGAVVERLTDHLRGEVVDFFNRLTFEPRDLLLQVMPLFANGHFRSCVSLHGTTIPVPKAPDLSIEEGARVCASWETHDENFFLSGPVAMQGFSTLWGLVGIDRIVAGERGVLQAGNGCLVSQDLSGMIQGTALESLLPGGRLRPIPFSAIPKLEIAGGDFLPLLEKMVHLVGIEGEICTDSSCQTPWASIALYFDLPLLKKNWETQGFRGLDLSGLLRGSRVEWPHLDLTRLPWPPGVEVLSGRADVSWRYDPDAHVTEIQAKAIDLQVILLDTPMTQPTHITGDLGLSMDNRGNLWVRMDHLSIDSPSVPLGGIDAGSLTATLDGELFGTVDLATYRPHLQEAHLEVSGVTLRTKPGTGIQWGPGGIVTAGELFGGALIDYVSGDTQEPLRVQWNLEGTVLGNGTRDFFEWRNVVTEGQGGWRVVAGRIVPNLGGLQARFQGDLSGTLENGTVYWSDGVWAALKGLDLDGMGQGGVQRASLEMGTEEAHIGPFTVVPSMTLTLEEIHSPAQDRYDLKADGKWIVRVTPLLLETGATIHLETDGSRVQWSNLFDRGLTAGSMAAIGQLRVEGEGADFKVVTETPYTLFSGDQTVAKGVTVTGGSQSDRLDLGVRVPSLGDRAHLAIQLRKRPGSDRFYGSYRLGSRPVRIDPELALKDLEMRGSFSTPSGSDLLVNPRVWTRGQFSGVLEGLLGGPVAAVYRGTVRPVPEKSEILFTFVPGDDSIMSFGPIVPRHQDDTVKGRADLVGTVVLDLSDGLRVRGRRLGVEGGTVFVGLDGGPVPVAAGHEVPALKNLSLVADRLLGISRGVAYGGGDGIGFETTIDLQALGLAQEPGESTTVVRLVFDRMPFSVPGYWRSFKNLIGEMKKGQRP